MPPLPPTDGWRPARRALLGCLAVFAATAATLATAAFLEVGSLGRALHRNPTIHLPGGVLKPTAPGEPQTLLLVGDDRRPAPRGKPDNFVLPHSNEMLLVRLDPGRPTISMLSVPRDLRATIHPDHGRPTVKRINVAYTIGGIGLMARTIEHLLGVAINHVVVITFPHFRRAVDEMGCVFTTVDRRYYHSNAAGGQQYFEINLQPGYQQLCGTKALQFVAYRHGDTALVRDARDQRFLLDAKAQYGPSLISSRDRFERIFGGAVQTDIHGTSAILDLLQLLAGVAGKPVRQVHFRASIGPIFVTASPGQIHASVAEWLRGTAAPPRVALRSSAGRAPARRHVAAPAGLTLSPASQSRLAAARTAARVLPFALEYPRALVRDPGSAPETLRTYALRDQHHQVHSAYVVAVDRGRLGEFYDVQGTGWQDPPLLANPTQTVRVGARTYGLFYEGDNLRVIAWREGHAAYWITNTLTDALTPRAMLAIAEQTLPVLGAGAGRRARLRPRAFLLPKRTPAGQPSDLVATSGALLALLALAGVGLLGLRLAERARDLRQLRAECERMARHEAAIRAARMGADAAPRAADLAGTRGEP